MRSPQESSYCFCLQSSRVWGVLGVCGSLCWKPQWPSPAGQAGERPGFPRSHPRPTDRWCSQPACPLQRGILTVSVPNPRHQHRETEAWRELHDSSYPWTSFLKLRFRTWASGNNVLWDFSQTESPAWPCGSVDVRGGRHSLAHSCRLHSPSGRPPRSLPGPAPRTVNSIALTLAVFDICLLDTHLGAPSSNADRGQVQPETEAF